MIKPLQSLFVAGLLISISFTSIAQQFSPRYELVKMGPEVNSKTYHEVAPVISTDGKKLYFVINDHPNNTYGRDNSQDIWTSNLDEKGWTPAKRISAPLNQNRYNGVFNVLPDGSLFVRGGKAKNSKGFSIVSPSGGWTEIDITDFTKMDKGTFNGGSISADAKHIVLYFSEVAGNNRSDLYVTNQQADGTWPKPVKLSLSTGGDEFGPFIGPDQKTLFFASDRIVPGRVGKEDIYKVTRLDDTWTKWSDPVNLGKAINTTGGDAYFSMDAQGNVFTCRMGSLIDGGNFDIFILKPRDVKITLQATIQNEKTQRPVVTSADLFLKEAKTSHKTDVNGKFEAHMPETDGYRITVDAPGFMPKDQSWKIPHINNDTTIKVVINLTPVAKKLILVGNTYDKKTSQLLTSKVDITAKKSAAMSVKAEGGKFQQELPGLGWYSLTATAEGYLNATDSVNAPSADETPVYKDLYLAPIEVGLTVRLKSIYFDYDKTTLQSKSFVELNKVVTFLKSNPRIAIEIAGHTDSNGPDDYNLNLSQGRSQSVVNYLISQGIDTSRLTAQGYGESKPIDTNDTDDGRANNRRVEFTVIKN